MTPTERRADRHSDPAAGEDDSSPTEPSESDEPAAQSLALDEIFEILKNERRRMVLEYLLEAEGTVEIGELSEALAARENDKSVREITSVERKRVYVGLYQVHLPKMDSMGIVDFNKSRGTIEARANIHRLTPYMDRIEAPAPGRWPSVFVALSVASLVGFVGMGLVDGATAVPLTVLWSVLSLTALTCLSLLFYRRTPTAGGRR